MMLKKNMTFLLSSSSSFLAHLLDYQTFIIILCLAGILPLRFHVNCLGDAPGNASLVSRSHGLLLAASHRYEQIPDLDQMSSSTDNKYPSASSASFSTNKETAKDSKTTTESSGLLGRLLSVIRSAPEDKEFIPILKNCTLPLISEVSSGNLFRNLDWNYFAFRVNRQGSERFDVLRSSFSHVVSYGAFKRLLFPSRTERNHVYFDCAFDKFFNAMMNRTPYVWIQWVSFDGIKFPFVLWQKVNITLGGVIPVSTLSGSQPTLIDVDAVPPPGGPSSWLWESGGPSRLVNEQRERRRQEQQEISFIPDETSISSNPSTPRDSPASLDASETNRTGVWSYFPSLVNRALSIYNIYQNWEGLPGLEVKVALV